MISKVQSAAVRGIDGFLVGVEMDLTNGLPTFTTVGLPDDAIREARERVVSAVRNSGFEFPHSRLVVNLAPAELRKAGTQLDLPMGLGALLASGQLSPAPWHADYCLLGELALDGSVRPVSGVLSMASAAREQGARGLILPAANAREGAAAGLPAHGVSSLRDAVRLLEREAPPEDRAPAPEEARDLRPAADLVEVKGQRLARRALEIAAAGGHNLLMVGPPGTGKSMLARRLPGILPPLNEEESFEVTKIFSVAGLLAPGAGLLRTRPLRAPHHTASLAAFTGGGPLSRPGEISLAHRGVLYLDEAAEFPRSLLEALRQPLEDRRLTVCRVRETVEYPADFMLVAAMNPCPCGYRGHAERPCRCGTPAVSRYRARISGPFLDRMDLQVELAPLSFREWAPVGGALEEDSAAVRERVEAVRARSKARAGCLNARLDSTRLAELCRLDARGWACLEAASKKSVLSARALDRTLRVARTIADLGRFEKVLKEHLQEALQYRALDRPLEISA